MRWAWELFLSSRSCILSAISSASFNINIRLAGRNLALGRPSEQSSTLWNYNSDLATDGDPDSCSWTPKSGGQRWWQVDLQDEFTVQAVAVTVEEESYQHFTVFIIGTEPINPMK